MAPAASPRPRWAIARFSHRLALRGRAASLGEQIEAWAKLEASMKESARLLIAAFPDRSRERARTLGGFLALAERRRARPRLFQISADRRRPQGLDDSASS
jgi:hypothetical protein